MSNISKTTQRLFNLEGGFNTKHELTDSERLELMACALADVPAYNWFNRDIGSQEEFLVDGNFMSYEEYLDDMYKSISKATHYLIGESEAKMRKDMAWGPSPIKVYGIKKNKTIKK